MTYKRMTITFMEKQYEIYAISYLHSYHVSCLCRPVPVTFFTYLTICYQISWVENDDSSDSMLWIIFADPTEILFPHFLYVR